MGGYVSRSVGYQPAAGGYPAGGKPFYARDAAQQGGLS